MESRAVVTGGAGFIGSRLSEELVKLGYSISILDNLSSGNRENLRHVLQSDKAVKLIVGDCKNITDVKKSLAGADHNWASASSRLQSRRESTAGCEFLAPCLQHTLQASSNHALVMPCPVLSS